MNLWSILMLSIGVIHCLVNNVFGQKLFGKSFSFDVNGVVAAFGDFDFDRVTDVVMITESGRSLQLLKGHENEPYLRLWPNIYCSFGNTSNETIVGVIAADFTGIDGNTDRVYMDLLVVSHSYSDLTSSSNHQSNDFKLWLFRGNRTDFDCNTITPLARNVRSFPSTLDFNGDMITDFIVETDFCSKQLWIKLEPKCLKQLQTKQLMTYPNSNAFIDLSHPKDFRPDLFIRGTDFIEYWFNTKDYKELSYPNKSVYQFLGQSSFADIDSDGIIDHILPVCRSYVDTCESPQILVLSQKGSYDQWIEVLDLENKFGLTFTQTTIWQSLHFFVTLRVGDIDSDGYPDFVTLMRENNSNHNKVVWLKSYGSDKNVFNRQFRIEWMSDSISFDNNQTNPYLTSIFDFEEDGKLDILVGSHIENYLNLNAFINNGKSSSNFLKVFVSSGICNQKDVCPQIGTPLIGSHLCLSPSEGNHMSCSGQMSQTQHFALQLPFAVFGLGSIPNFVENLSVSIPSGGDKIRDQTWYELIPDSRIVIIPFPADDTNKWIQKIYLNPKYFAFQTLITLITICCILVVIIAVLHKRDLKQDIVEHREYKKHWL